MKYQKTLFGEKVPVEELKIRERLAKQMKMIEKATEEFPDDDHANLCPWLSGEEWTTFMCIISEDGFSYNKFDEMGMHYIFDLFDKFAHIITGFNFLRYKGFTNGI